MTSTLFVENPSNKFILESLFCKIILFNIFGSEWMKLGRDIPLVHQGSLEFQDKHHRETDKEGVGVALATTKAFAITGPKATSNASVFDSF